MGRLAKWLDSLMHYLINFKEIVQYEVCTFAVSCFICRAKPS